VVIRSLDAMLFGAVRWASARWIFVVLLLLGTEASLGHSAAAASDAPTLYVEVEDPLGIARRAWPVSAGVPFPQGALRDVAHLRLRAEADATRAVPVQSRTLSHWPDGSVRWAWIDWQTDLTSGERRRFHLTVAPPDPATDRVSVTTTAESIAVDTGVLRFVIPTTRFAIAEDVHLHGKVVQAAGIQAFMSIEAQHRVAGPPDSVEIVEDGPLRARLAIRGTYGLDFHYVTRIDAHAGQSFIRVLHSFENRGLRPSTSVRQIAMDVPVAMSGTQATYRYGRDPEAPLLGELSDAPIVILQEDNQTLRSNGVVQAGNSAGWIEARDEAKGIAVVSRFAWQEYPQSVHLTASRLRFNLWAPESLPASIGMGAAKTHEFAVAYFADVPPSDEELLGIAEPLVGYVNPEWVVATQALPNSVARNDATAAFLDEVAAGFQRYRETADTEPWDDWGGLDCAAFTGERQRTGFYGMLNWGDWNSPWYRDMVNGCETWGNLEYDTTQVFALAYAATGDRALHSAMTAAARHFMDVDRIHAAPPACDCVGMTHQRVSQHFNFELGGPDLGYTWTEGLLSYFYLTGDERALTAVRGIADYLVRRVPRAEDALTPRQWAWPQIALLAAYEGSGDVRYKKAARLYAQGSMKAYPPDRGTDLGIGMLGDALAYVDRHMPNATVRAWLVAHAAAVMSARGGADPRFFPAVAYVGRATQNEDYQRAAVAALERQQFSNWGKPFTLAGRTGFRILSLQQ